MNADNRLDYEVIVAEYWENLNTVLRNFRPATEYLDLWVPDEDHIKSILNMIESAQIAGQHGIALYIGPDTLNDIDVAQLKEQAAEFGKVHIEMEGDGLVFEIAEIN